MRTEGKSKRKLAWRSTCLVCKATLDCFYTIGVALLAFIVCLIAYSITIDEAPMPNFLVRLLEKELKAQGATMSMSGIRIQPNGRVTIDHPKIYSTDLQSEIARADRISLKVDRALLLFGKARMTELNVINGALITPALLSKSGVPEAQVDQIDLRVGNQRDGWVVKQSKLRFGSARVSINGIVDPAILTIRKTPETPKPLSEQLVTFYKKASEIKAALAQVNGLEARIRVEAPRKGPQSASAVITALDGKWPGKASAEEVLVDVHASLGGSASVSTRIGAISAPKNTVVNNIEMEAHWPQFPTAENWQPSHAQVSIGSGGQERDFASSLSFALHPVDAESWQADGYFQIVDSSWKLSTVANPTSKTATVELTGSPTQGLVELAIGLAKQMTPNIGKLPIEGLAQVIDPPDLQVSAQFDGKLKPTSVDATLEVGRLISLEAPFDRAIAQATLRGNQLEVPNLWLRSGKQKGRLSVSLDLETKRRRLLIDGLFNPNTVNGWIPDPWWTELWSNFQFPEEGFYCLMDSSQIIKRPETLWLTGYGICKDLEIRGHPMEEIETHMFILQRYIDLYNLTLTRKEGSIVGDGQFSIAEDPRDGIYKMTALWLDAESTIDLSIGPDLIYEVRDSVEEILEPYGYTVPPKVVARSASTMHKDRFTYDVDLQIDTDNAFNYYDYPLDSLNAIVRVGNGRADIPSAKARLAGGTVNANATVRNENIDLSVTLSDARFGDTLKASAAYFRANDPDSSAHGITADELSAYGGTTNLHFEGKGKVGDSLSYEGQGTYQISGAKLTDLPLLGGISRALDSAGLPIATLKFSGAEGVFNVQKRYVEFPELRLVGPIAQIKSSGKYDLKDDELDFRARLQPLRSVVDSVPFLNIGGRVLDLFTGIFEVRLTGPISDPKKSVFRETPKREEAVPAEIENASE